jgi:hypothetical protein
MEFQLFVGSDIVNRRAECISHFHHVICWVPVSLHVLWNERTGSLRAVQALRHAGRALVVEWMIAKDSFRIFRE